MVLEECPIDVIRSMLDQGFKPEEDGTNFAAMKGRDDVVNLLEERGFHFSTNFEEIDQLVRWNSDLEKMDAVYSD